jgi:hypothetical protein
MRKVSVFLLFLSLILTFTFSGRQAGAEVEIQELHNVFDKLTLGMHLSTVYRFDQNTYFGADITEDEGDSTDFGEIWASFSLTAQKDVGWSIITAQIAPYYTETIGQDFYAIYKDESEFEMDQAWLQFGNLFNSPFDVTIGRQNIQIEKWFIMGDGELQPAAAWLAWHYSFPFAVRIDGDFGPLKMTSFWASSDDYYQSWYENIPKGPKSDVDVAGINLHYDLSETTYFYGGYYRKFDTSDLMFAGYTPQGQTLEAENETNAFDLGFDSTISNLHLEGEFVYQTGDAGEFGQEDRDREAMGYFARATYTFPVRFSPFIRGQYAYFSGDDDYEDDEAEDYDPMFIGFMAWNEWIIGELVGEAHLPDSNKKDILVSVGLSPVERMTATLMYINHQLDEEYYLFPANQVQSDDWADEINLLIDYLVTDNLLVHLGLGYVVPDDAAEQAYGDDEDAYFTQLWLDFSF